MKYLLIAIVMGTLALVSVPTSADSGVAVNATTIIVGGSGGNSGGFDSGGSYTYGSPDWASQFPSMNQPQSSSPSSSYIPVQQPVEIPPVIAPQNQYVPPAPVAPATPSNPVSKMDWIILGIIVAGACVVGLVVWIISKFVDNYREDSTD